MCQKEELIVWSKHDKNSQFNRQHDCVFVWRGGDLCDKIAIFTLKLNKVIIRAPKFMIKVVVASI